MNKNHIINANLPLLIKVIEKTGYNRYNLRFGNINLSTKSMLNLEINQEYYANIDSQSSGVIKISNLVKRQNPTIYLKDGKNLIEKIAQNNDISWLFDYIKNKLANSATEYEFQIYSNMILALNEGIVVVPFLYENMGAMIQIKQSSVTELFFIISTYPPFILKANGAKFISVKSPYRNFSRLIGKALKCEEEVGKVSMFWGKKENFLDYKG